MSAIFDSDLKQLQEDLGDEEINYNVGATMVAADDFSGTAEEILAKYDKYKVIWEISADATRI